MSNFICNRPFAIHLGLDEISLNPFALEAHSRGMSIFFLDFTGVRGIPALCGYLAQEFMFPHETSGLDSAVDLISDLVWFGNDNGYLIVACGLLQSSTTAQAFAGILPNIVDRWRAQGVPFVVAIQGRTKKLEKSLKAANAEMKRFGSLPWAPPGTGAVDIIHH
jgi:hypothetical protein